jgi:uncharacterized membrane protein
MVTTLTIIKTFAVIGVLDTVYLVWKKLTGADVACVALPERWCTKVQYSKQSVTFGVPNSVWGFLMYSGILFFAVLQPDMPFWPIQALVGIGFVFSLYFTFIQTFVIRALCVWCVISAINFTVMFWAIFVR